MGFIENISWELSIIGVALSLFTLINVVFKTEKHKTDILLIIWLIILIVPLVHSITEQMHLNNYTFKLFSNPSLNLLHGPLLYYYVLILVKKEFAIKPIHLLHLLPFVVLYFAFIASPHPLPLTPRPLADFPPLPVHEFNHPMQGKRDLFKPLLINFGVLNVVSFIIYSLLSITQLFHHQKKIKGYFSQQNNQITLKWLYLLPTVFTLLILTNLINEYSIFDGFVVLPLTLHLLSNFIFILLLCFFGVKQQPLFSEPKVKLLRTPTIEPTPPQISLHSPENKAISPSSEQAIVVEKTQPVDNILPQVNQYMLEHKPYLDPDLSIYSLSQALNIPRQSLSKSINSGLSKNFFQYINEYRIKEAQARLRDQQEKHLTILDIALASGFNSKSSFYNLFKQYCQLSPLQYRKEHSKNQAV